MTDSVTLGIDPAKKKFTACLLDAKGQTLVAPRDFQANRAGYDALLAAVAPHRAGVRLVVGIEATASLDDNLLALFAGDAAKKAGPVLLLRLDAAQVARFSGAKPVRGKTDSADARRIARFALAHAAELHAFEVDPDAQAMLRMVNEREHLVEANTASANRLQDRLVVSFPEFPTVLEEPCGDLALAVLLAAPTAALCARKQAKTLAAIRPARKGSHELGEERAAALLEAAKRSIASAVSPSDADAIVHLVLRLQMDRERIAVIEAAILEYVHALDESAVPTVPTVAEAAEPATVREQIGLAQTMPGIGLVGAACVVLRCQGLARFTDAKALAAQMGTCPDRQQTGSSKNRGQLTHRGDRRTRGVLFVLVLGACNYDPAMAFHKWRHIRKGLTPLQAVCACMNRYAKILWTLAHTKTAYDPAKAIESIKTHHADLWAIFLKEQLPDLKRLGKDQKESALAA